MTDSASPQVEPFTVGALTISAIEAFFSAAALHLGETLPDGRRLQATDPMEAWRALLGASALINQLGPLMVEAKLGPYQAGLDHLLERLAVQHPTMQFPLPTWLREAAQRARHDSSVGNLEQAVRDGMASVQPLAATLALKPPTSTGPSVASPKPPPTMPGTGLPKQGGSGPLFPRH